MFGKVELMFTNDEMRRIETITKSYGMDIESYMKCIVLHDMKKSCMKKSDKKKAV